VPWQVCPGKAASPSPTRSSTKVVADQCVCWRPRAARFQCKPPQLRELMALGRTEFDAARFVFKPKTLIARLRRASTRSCQIVVSG
jgi:hypothetical protein